MSLIRGASSLPDLKRFGRGVKVTLLTFTAILVAASAAADDYNNLFIGIGYDDLKDYNDPAPIASIDYDFKQVRSSDRFRWRVSGMATTDSDYWAGAGISYTRPFGKGPWFVEASFLPGVFYRNNGDNGSNGLHFPMFRTQVGIGRFMKNGSSIAVILSHHSDGGLEEPAGSTDSVLLRYGFSF